MPRVDREGSKKTKRSQLCSILDDVGFASQAEPRFSVNQLIVSKVPHAYFPSDSGDFPMTIFLFQNS